MTTDIFKLQKNPDGKFYAIRKEGESEVGRTGFYSLTSAIKFIEACLLPDEEESDVCEMCEGTGFVTTMGYVYAGEPHMAMIDEAPCPECRSYDDDYNNEE